MAEGKIKTKLAILAEYGYQIAHERNLDNLVELLALQVKQLLEADRCSVFVLDHKKQELWSKVAQGVTNKVLRFPISQGIVGYVARTGNHANIPDAYQDPHFNPQFDLENKYKTHSILAMPMKNTLGRVVGVFQVLNKFSGPFTEEDEGLLNLLASIAAAAIENAELYKIKRMNEYETIMRLATLVQLRDTTDLAGHLKRMSEYSRLIAKAMGLQDDEAENIYLASLLHDVGKVGIPDRILLLERPLTDEEYEEMKKHTIYGYNVLSNSDSELLNYARNVAVGHHERYDGTGYPYAIAGDAIPLEARIVALADVFDALMSRRVYKSGWELPDVLKYIEEESGKHFDPLVVQAFLTCLPAIKELLEKEKGIF